MELENFETIRNRLNDFVQSYEPESDLRVNVYRTLLSDNGKLEAINFLLDVIEEMKGAK